MLEGETAPTCSRGGVGAHFLQGMVGIFFYRGGFGAGKRKKLRRLCYPGDGW